MIGLVGEHLRGVVEEQPNPPREVDSWQLLATIYRSRTALTLAIFGVLLGGLCIVLGLLIDGDWAAKAFLLGIGGVVLLLCVASPSLLALRARNALLRGIRANAEVLSVEWTGPGDASTMDSFESGMARGRRRILHPNGSFDSDFETDSAWSGHLRAGSIMLVLVDRDSRKVLFDLGPADPTAFRPDQVAPAIPLPGEPPSANSNRLRLAGWAAGGVVALALALAAFFLMRGDGSAAVKLLLFAFLAPAIALCVGLVVSVVRQPGWYKGPPEAAWVAGMSGVILVFVPILVYLPWAPDRFPLDSMPFGLPLLFTAGTVLVFAGAISGVVLGLRAAWRRRDWAQIVSLAVIAALIGYGLVKAIQARA